MKRLWRVLLVSRNNPEMIIAWAENNPFLAKYALNIDESTDNKLALEIKNNCERYGICYEIAHAHGMYANIDQFIEYYSNQGVSYTLYMHHDAYFFSETDAKKIDKLADKIQGQDFGLIGFNVINGEKSIDSYLRGSEYFGITSRSILGYTQGYYRNSFFNRTDYSKFPRDRAFSVESVMWTTALLNNDLFQKNIIPDSKFSFFHSWDDIAHQFLLKCIHNICAPFISVAHDQAIKEKYGFLRSSPRGSKEQVTYYYGTDGTQHLIDWKKKWGYAWSLEPNSRLLQFLSQRGGFISKLFRFSNKIMFRYMPSIIPTKSHMDYKANRNKYKDSFLELYFLHDPSKGPVKVFDHLQG